MIYNILKKASNILRLFVSVNQVYLSVILIIFLRSNLLYIKTEKSTCSFFLFKISKITAHLNKLYFLEGLPHQPCAASYFCQLMCKNTYREVHSCLQRVLLLVYFGSKVKK